MKNHHAFEQTISCNATAHGGMQSGLMESAGEVVTWSTVSSSADKKQSIVGSCHDLSLY